MLHDSLQTCFKQAQQKQLADKNEEAIALFKRCLAIDSPDTLTQLKLQPIVIDAMQHLFDCYKSASKNDECLEAFNQMHAHPTQVVKNYCWRDLHTLQAYATFFSDKGQTEAESLILRALKMPLKGLKETEQEDDCNKRNLEAEREFRDYSYASAICYNNSERQDDVIRWCKKAIEKSKLCNDASGSQLVLARLSAVYMKRSQVIDAINLSDEATSYAQSTKDTISYINACNVLSCIYHEIQMPDLANKVADDAINLLEQSTRRDPVIAAKAYLCKSNAWFTIKNNKECLNWWKKANELSKKMPYDNIQYEVDFSYAAYLINLNQRNDLQQAISMMQKVVKHSVAFRSRAYHYLARAYEQIGNEPLCEAMLDSMYHYEHATNPPILARRATNFAITHYLRTKNAEMVARYTADQQLENETFHSREVMQRLVKDMVQKKVLAEQKELADARQQGLMKRWIHLSINALFAAAIFVFIFILIRRRRKHSHEKQKIMQAMSEQKQELDNVTQQLELAKSQINRQAEMLKYIDTLSTETGMRKFEVLFEKYYPNFVKTIRDTAPDLNRKEFITCLLIYLGLNSTQIAQSLNVNPRTVTVYRYRLKQKLKLENETLDEFYARMRQKD